MKSQFALIAALAVATLPLDASAQAWLSNPDFSEGVGIRAGNLEWHPSLGGEFGYDSNFFRASSASERVIDVLRLRVTPSFTVTTLGARRRNAQTPPTFAFVGGADAAYNEIIPLDSSNSAVSKQRNLALGANAKLDFYPQGKLGVDVLGSFVRMIEPTGNAEDLVHGGFNRDTAHAGAGVTWRPGGGLFDWRLGYAITYNYFEQQEFSPLDNVQHDIQTRGRWRFLPRSALLFDSSYTFVRYSAADSRQTDGDMVRTRIGFRGLVTYHLALLGMVGWGSTFYKSRGGAGLKAQNYDAPLGTAEVRWFMSAAPTPDKVTVASGLSSIALGYVRSFDNAYLGSFFTQDRGYLQFNGYIVGRVVSGLEFGVSRVAFPESTYAADTAPAFDELRLDARAFGEYRITDTFATNLTFLYDGANAGPARVHGEDLDYKRYQVYLGARLFW